MKAALPTREPLMLEHWQAQALYQQICQTSQGRPYYILHDGPPYANGHLHIGHAVNKILKDFIIKSKRLSGFNAPFVPGWDCHGLPIELNVEKKFKASGKNYTPAEFRQACRDYAKEQIAIQRAEFKRLGILADWDNPYITMDFATEAEIIRALGQCIKSGYMDHGFKPVHWCVACGSALAELEVEYKDKKSTAIDVKFKVCKSAFIEGLPGHGELFIPIWTTTPWTLPSNEAVALGPELEYTLIQIEKERLLIARNLYQSCLERYAYQSYKVLRHYPGKAFNGLQLEHPFEPRQVPLIMSEHVVTDTGTGAVHIAPAHGPEDYSLGLTYQLSLHGRVNTKGYYQSPPPGTENVSVLKADPILVELVREHDKLLCVQTLNHSYPHCWRHKIPLIFLATPQWFLRLQDTQLRQKLNQAVQSVQWSPRWGKNRMQAMLGESPDTARPDWCLSRQRHWGVPLPLFVHRQTGQWHPKTLELIERIAQRVEKEGIEAWYQLETQSLLGEEARDYQKLTDTLDVWFDSGVTHHAVLKKDLRLKWPADLYLEGSDQFRGWFQSSLLTGVVLDGQAPYRQVLVHGFTVDNKGHKMSKSIGNVIHLDTLLNKWGADIVRLWIASTDTQSEITVSDEIFQRTAEAYRRIRNTLRFLLSNLHDFNPAHDAVEQDQLLSLDRWLLMRTQTLQRDIQYYYENFSFHLIYQAIHHFCIHELGSFYLSILKDRQYTMQANSQGRRSGQTALYYVAESMLRWLAPIMSFTAEEAWQHLPGSRSPSILLTQWYSLDVQENTDRLASFYQEAGGSENCWEKVIQLREIVNKAIETARNANQIGSALEANLIIFCQPNSFIARLLNQLANELHFIFLTSSVKVLTEHEITLDDTGISIQIIPTHAAQLKCARCWHRREDVGKDSAHPTLCSRCITNLPQAIGETRYYA
jgi:isoleucyl-tRNA synthetase